MGAVELADYLKDSGTIKSERLYEAFKMIDRKNFVPTSMRAFAYADNAISIGKGQTISQPYTVAFMLELLDVKIGQRVLDVGAGSGWTTALLAHLVGKKGVVFGAERIPELVPKAQERLRKYSFNWARIQLTTDAVGLVKEAPFDRILVSATFHEVPRQLLSQLKTPGKLVMPVGQSIISLIKTSNGVKTQVFPGFVFVPLIF